MEDMEAEIINTGRKKDNHDQKSKTKETRASSGLNGSKPDVSSCISHHENMDNIDGTPGIKRTKDKLNQEMPTKSNISGNILAMENPQ